MVRQRARDSRKSRKASFRELFCVIPRRPSCMFRARHLVPVPQIDPQKVREILSLDAKTIEHQFIKLKDFIILKREDCHNRIEFTKHFLDCITDHHGIVYQGVLFGSTINGLGFRDSDVDLRLRPLYEATKNNYEPIDLDDELVEQTLRDISYQTNRCIPSSSAFVPSRRCPISKLKFLHQVNENGRHIFKEGLNFDVSLSTKNSLGSFNSSFLRFICKLSPKFHLLATFIRYWSKAHDLIRPGELSSYALINMLIFYCQTLDKPLLPTVDQMREKFLENEDETLAEHLKKSMTQLEWHCLISLDMKKYPPCQNQESLTILTLKFFEFYLKFPYNTHIVTIRPGRALTHAEFKASGQYHPQFSIRTFLNIQDPFDLKHNVSAGIESTHFMRVMQTIASSYSELHKQITTNFIRPKVLKNANIPNVKHEKSTGDGSNGNDKNNNISCRSDRNWGLNALFVSNLKLPKKTAKPKKKDIKSTHATQSKQTGVKQK